MADLKILIVEDSEAMQRILTNTLGKLGYADTTAANNGEEALKLIETAGWTAILSNHTVD